MDGCECPDCGRDMLRIDALRDGEVVESLFKCPEGHAWLERRDERGERIVLAIT